MLIISYQFIVKMSIIGFAFNNVLRGFQKIKPEIVTKTQLKR